MGKNVLVVNWLGTSSDPSGCVHFIVTQIPYAPAEICILIFKSRCRKSFLSTSKIFRYTLIVKFFMPAICWLRSELFRFGDCKFEIRIITEQNE